MIDTVVLLLPQHAYQITEPDKFLPSARWIIGINSSAVHGIQSRQNPTKKELSAGLYKPRLTLFYRHHGEKQVMLKIELSLPKLSFGNNFQELKQKDLQPLLTKLSATLNQMGVIADPQELAKAPVSAIHFSKNIVLTDGSTPYHYISKLKESNMKMSLDVNQTDYRNEGHSYKWHTNSYEVVFYDKIKDLEKAKQSEKRSIEKDNAIQLELFPRLRKKKKLEVLRMEVRLNKRAKMKQLFAKLGIRSDLSLKSLFKPAISKRVLLHYLDELENKRPSLLDYKTSNDKVLLVDLLINNPSLSAKKIIQIYGLYKANEIMSLRELKEIFKQNRRDWNKIINEAKKIKLHGIKSSILPIRQLIMKNKLIPKHLQKSINLMNNQLQISTAQTRHFIYLDNNIFRRLKRNPDFWNNFFDLFNKDFPEVFYDFQFLFTWCQLVEDLNLGTILTKMEQTPFWKKTIEGKTIFGPKDHADALDIYFKAAYEAIKTLPELQQIALLDRIDISLSYCSQEAGLLTKNTLIIARDLVQKNNYINELAFELAWAFITSYPYISSSQQWIDRSTYLESLLSLWHKFDSEKREFNLYRLLERHYDSYTKHHLGLDYETHKNENLLIEHIKHLSDLCDGELIHHTHLGTNLLPNRGKIKVIGITFDEENDVLPKVVIFKQGLATLKRDVQGWNVSEVPGEIFCVVKDDEDETRIIDIKRILLEGVK